MHSRMEDQMRQQQSNQQSSSTPPENKNEQVGDYIDFEEVK